MSITTPELFAMARGVEPRRGDERCFYCGASCLADIGNSVDVWVKKSFTGRDGVACPGSSYVCDGCVCCMDEKADVTLPNGEKRERQKVRNYSWIVTRNVAYGCTKSHTMELRSACLSPPDPPFSIVISDSGQTHQLYRGVVCHDRESVTVTLEGESVTYRPEDLRDRVELCKRLIRASGKPALKGEPSVGLAIRLFEESGDVASLETWERVREEPLSRLAVWLAPSKEHCGATT